MKKAPMQPSAPNAVMYTPDNNQTNVNVVDNAEDGGLDETTVIKIEDPTTKETSILHAIEEDIAVSTAYATADYTVVYAKTAAFDVQNTCVGIESIGVGIDTSGLQSAAHKEKPPQRVTLMNTMTQVREWVQIMKKYWNGVYITPNLHHQLNGAHLI